jgi:hypothetical protein
VALRDLFFFCLHLIDGGDLSLRLVTRTLQQRPVLIDTVEDEVERKFKTLVPELGATELQASFSTFLPHEAKQSKLLRYAAVKS